MGIFGQNGIVTFVSPFFLLFQPPFGRHQFFYFFGLNQRCRCPTRRGRASHGQENGGRIWTCKKDRASRIRPRGCDLTPRAYPCDVCTELTTDVEPLHHIVTLTFHMIERR